MLKTSSLVRGAVATAAFLIAGSAFAGEFVPEIGIGKASGKDIDLSGESSRDTWTYTAAMGYVWDTGLGVRVITIANGVEKKPGKLGSPGVPMYGWRVKILDESTGQPKRAQWPFGNGGHG